MRTEGGRLDVALAGAVFPLGREHLVQVARENEAPSGLLTLLSCLPDGPFSSLREVERLLEGLVPTQPDSSAGP